MTDPATSQDNFSFRLAQWLVEQFDSHEALGTVSNQLTTLISQEQPDSRTNLNVHIGGLIFKKATHNPTDGLVQLCTRLCHSLFLQDIKRDSSFPSKSAHDRTFQLCIGSLEAINSEQKDDQGVPLSHISVLVTELYNYGLIPIAHVYAYLRRLTTLNGPLESRILGLCTILEAIDWALNVGPWRTEAESVIQWANDTVEKSPLDEYVKTRIKTVACAQNGSGGWQAYSELGLPVEEQIPLGLATPEQYTSSTGNPPAQSQATNDAVSNYQTVIPEHSRAERNESSAAEGAPSRSSTLSEDDAQTPNSQEVGRPSGSASPAQSIVDGENPNRNNYGHNTVAQDGEVQGPQPVASPPQLATATPEQAAPSAAPSRAPQESGHEPGDPARLAIPIPPSMRQSILGQPAVKPTTPWDTEGLRHRPAAGSISFGIVDAPKKEPGPAATLVPAPAPAPVPAPATSTTAPKPTYDINIVAPKPPTVAPKPATPTASSTSTPPSATPKTKRKKQKKLNVHALVEDGGSPRPTQPPPSIPPVPSSTTASSTAISHALPPIVNQNTQAVTPQSVQSPALNVWGAAFVPSSISRQAVRINTPNGNAVLFGNQIPASPKAVSNMGSGVVIPKRASVAIRMETEEQKNARLAKEQEEKERKEREAKEAKEKEEREAREKEEAERKAKEEEERKAKEEEERKIKEEEERLAKEEADRLAKEEEERRLKEEEERRIREEEERTIREEVERRAKEIEELKARLGSWRPAREGY